MPERRLLLEPLHRRDEVQLGQVPDQIDGPTTANTSLPVAELRPTDRERALFGVPLGAIAQVACSTACAQHILQGNEADAGGPLAGGRFRTSTGYSLAHGLDEGIAAYAGLWWDLGESGTP